MSSKIGRFEILSEIANSGSTAVYKASDGEGGQTIALKALSLEGFGAQAPALVQSVMQEAEGGKKLNSGNIAQVIAVEEIEGKLVAVVEYVQGNSIGTMLARKEGFSIWDLQDIARQTCQALDHASTRKIVHYTLEPDKIMVTWDGSTKVLGYGISMMNAHVAQAQGKAPAVLHYMSPEQLRGDPMDVRSNLFSLGAILYEMVTDRKAFDGEDADQVRQQILEGTPVPMQHFVPKANSALSTLILKALSKDPEQRYQSGQELISDLEKCKNQPAAAVAAKPAAPPRGFTSPVKTAPPAANSGAGQSGSQQAKPVTAASAAAGSTGIAQAGSADPKPKAAAAAAGHSFGSATAGTPSATPQSATSEEFISAVVKASLSDTTQESPKMSAAPADVETLVKPQSHSPKIAVDPMMAEAPKPAGGIRSFSEIEELPPLKEEFVAPPPAAAPAPPEEPEQPEIIIKTPTAAPPKPRVPPRVVAKKAVNEIKKTPPQLFGYSIAAAVAIIVLIIGGIAYHIHSQNVLDDELASQAAETAPVNPAPAKAPNSVTSAAVPQAQLPAQVTPPPVEAAPPTEEQRDISVREKRGKRYQRRTTHAAPAIVPAQLTINSTPEGAQVSVDGQTESSWITPFNATNLTPGQHTIVISKSGFATQTRVLEASSGSKALLVIQLAATTSILSVNSSPEGAEIVLDGHRTGHVTPAQLTIEKAGSHTLLFHKQGYLDESTSTNVQMGQNVHFSTTLKVLGITDDIHYKKFLGGGKLQGQGTVSIKTDPKGAQVAINRRILDRNTPVEFYLNPGLYVVDITMSGYKPLHRVIKVDRDGKLNIEESLQNE